MTARSRRMLLVLILALFFSLAPSGGLVGARALSGQSRTVRVAYPIQAGLTDVNEDGSYSGYTYEYLEELAQYTGWDYEFVRAEGTLDQQLSTLMEQVRLGEIDLMGASVYSEALAEQYDYSVHSYGVSETVLQVPAELPAAVEINSQARQTLRVAVLNPEGRMARELADYCRMNLIDPVLVPCADEAGQLEAVRTGRADALLNSGLNYLEGVRTIARFAPKPFFFIMPKGADAQLAAQLNQAILDIEQIDPTLPGTLYDKYFSTGGIQLQLTDAERAYIARGEAVRVGVLEDQPPYQYRDGEGALRGISIDLLDTVSAQTGLAFTYTCAKTAAELDGLRERGEIDLVAGIPYHYETARRRGLAMTRPYVSAQYILVTSAEAAGNVVGRRLAMPETALYSELAKGQLVRCENAAESFEAIRRGLADYTYVDAYTAQYFINLPAYSDFKLVPQTFQPRRVCLGVNKPGQRELLSLLNKTIVSLPEEDLQALINKNTIVPQPNPMNEALRTALLTLLGVLALVVFGFAGYYVSKRRSESRLVAAKAQAEEAYARAETASRAKSEFLSRMSHEIRTPMNGISGMTAIALRSMEDPEKVADCLQKVQISSRHLLALVNDILDMSKIESGKLAFHREPFDFWEFWRELTALYGGQAAEKGLVFRSEAGDGVDPVLVGDSLRLHQILGNLLSNAFKFTPPGGTVTLRADAEGREADGVLLRFSVQDTGCGIEEEDRKLIFDPFEQGDGGLARRSGGTGLGLSIVKRFAEALGGRVSLQSQVGRGSTFTVLLPFGLAAAPPGAPPPGGGGAALEAFDFSGRRILLAEDNALNREIAAGLLGATGAAIDQAVDGQEAAERFAASPPGYYDLILMDIQMPRMNGYEATRAIRAMDRPDAAGVPIVAMTADAFAEDEERCLAAGMNAHLSKPIDVERTLKKLRECMTP